MIELNELGPVVDIAVGVTILMGTGAAVTWWLTRRVENRIKDEVKHMDRLQSIERRVTNVEVKMDRLQSIEMRVTNVEVKMDSMATKDDLAEMEAKMEAMEARMVTKDDVTDMKTELLEAIKKVNGAGHR